MLPKANVFFIEKDINDLKSIEGVTHAYTFECGMPKITLERLASAANGCHSLQVLVCSNPFMVKHYGLDKKFVLQEGSLETPLGGKLLFHLFCRYEFELRATLCTTVIGSGEKRQTYFFVNEGLLHEIDTVDRPCTGASTADDDISKAFEVITGGEQSILPAACRQLSAKGGLWSSERSLRSGGDFLDEEEDDDEEEEGRYSLYKEFCPLHVPRRNDGGAQPGRSVLSMLSINGSEMAKRIPKYVTLRAFTFVVPFLTI